MSGDRTSNRLGNRMGIIRNPNLDAHRRRSAQMTLEKLAADGVRPIGGWESVQLPLPIPKETGWTGASITSAATATTCAATNTLRSRTSD